MNSNFLTAKNLIQRGEVSLALQAMIDEMGLDDSTQLQSDGTMTIPGVLIATKDNATSLRVRGLQHPSEGVAQVQSYSGIFYNDLYDRNGGLKTRFIVGGNLEMDFELQTSNILKISAVDSAVNTGKILIGTDTDVVFNLRTDSDTNSVKQLVFDRVDVSTKGDANTSDVNIKSSAGHVCLQFGAAGAVMLPVKTTAERDVMTPAEGLVIQNSSTHKAQVYDGTAWQDLY